MKVFIKKSFAAILILAYLTSCSKKDNNTKIKTADRVTTANKVAKFWKNGVATSLTDESKNAAANSIYVVGNDVYVAGYENNIAKIWKNKTGVALSNGSSGAAANSVFVSGTDVYVAGYVGSQAVLWKNGVATSLSGGNAVANSVYVANGDIYVAGYSDYSPANTTALTIRVATFWKNGVITALATIPSSAASIYVSGNDVYVAGYQVSDIGGVKAEVWKNGVTLPLTGLGFGSVANSVYISGADVYAAGRQAQSLVSSNNVQLCTVWKNDTFTSFKDNPNEASANSIFVAGNDVYVAGYQYSGSDVTVNGNSTVIIVGRNIAKIWKNGIGTALTDGTKEASANSIYVSNNDVYVAGFEAVSK